MVYEERLEEFNEIWRRIDSEWSHYFYINKWSLKIYLVIAKYPPLTTINAHQKGIPHNHLEKQIMGLNQFPSIKEYFYIAKTQSTHHSVQLEVPTHQVHLHRHYAGRYCPYSVLIQGAGHNVRVLQFWISPDKAVVPSPLRAPTRYLHLVETRGHGDGKGAVAVDAVPAVIIDPPYLDEQAGPSSHAHRGVLQMEGLLKGSHSMGAFGLKALKLFLARQKFPVLALKYFGLCVKAAFLSVRGRGTSLLDVSRTFTSLPLTMSSGLLKFDIQIITQIYIQSSFKLIHIYQFRKGKDGCVNVPLKTYFKLSKLPLNNWFHLVEEVPMGVVAVPMDIVVFDGESRVFVRWSELIVSPVKNVLPHPCWLPFTVYKYRRHKVARHLICVHHNILLLGKVPLNASRHFSSQLLQNPPF